MTDAIVPQVTPNSTALNAEHYQSFEMAKANDDVIGGEDLAQLRSYSAAHVPKHSRPSTLTVNNSRPPTPTKGIKQ